MRKFLMVVAIIFLIVAVAALVLRWRAGRYLDARAAELEGEVAAFVAAHPAERPVVLGPATDGNAVDAYREIERAWAPPDAAGVPRPIPGLTDFIDRRDERDRGYIEYLEGEPSDIPAQIAAFLDEHAHLEAHVREGLQRRTCDWGLGATLENPYVVREPTFVMHVLARMMAAMAHRSRDPEEAMRLGLEIVGLGYDLSRGGSLSMQVDGGVVVVGIGIESLGRTVRRFPLSLDRGRRLADDLLALDATAFPLPDSFRMEQLGIEWWLSRRRSVPGAAGWAGRLARWTPTLLYAWEFPHIHDIFVLAVAASQQRFPRLEADAGPIPDRAAGHLLTTPVLVPRVVTTGRAVACARALVRAAAMLAVASGVRNDTGALPESAEALSAAWGRPLPEDPYAGGTMLYARLPAFDAAAAYGVGPNGDDRGDLHAMGQSWGGETIFVEVEGVVTPPPGDVEFVHGSTALGVEAVDMDYVRLDAHEVFVAASRVGPDGRWQAPHDLAEPYAGRTASGPASALDVRTLDDVETVGLVLLPRE